MRCLLIIKFLLLSIVLSYAGCHHEEMVYQNNLPSYPDKKELPNKTAPYPQNEEDSFENLFSAEYLVLFSINFADDMTGIATGASEYYLLTSDGGKTWNEHVLPKIGSKAPGEKYNLVKSLILTSGTVYIIGHLEESGSAIFFSSDFGQTWKLKTYSNTSLNDISTKEGKAWIVGNDQDSGIIFYTDSSNDWKQIWRKKQQFVSGITFLNDTEGWCVGGNGLIMHTTNGGQNWQIQNSKTKNNLESIAFADSQNGFAVGLNGTVLTTTDGGVSWETQESGTNESLMKVVKFSANEALATGENGTIIFTKDSGKNWRKLNYPIDTNINDINRTGNNIWIVSEGNIFRSSESK